ncbi:MAG TPA: dockerin type I domain-containing protein, partial [Lacipirellulaceae bacterium]|nr:dockerin type I domain-containing protein [Lacipirellulaceae bacterium]
SLNSGRLSTHLVSIGGDGALNLNGGVLNASAVVGSLVNRGTRISPGNGAGVMHVTGDLTMEAGVLEMEIAGAHTGEFDRIVVAGALSAGGVLDVRLLGGFTPAAGDSFDLFDFDSAAGTFTLQLPALGDDLSWDASNLLGNGTLSVVATPVTNADFNGDGVVDGDDLLMWKAGFGFAGQTTTADGDANGDGRVDGADFLLWQQQLFKAAMSRPVPEPMAFGMLAPAAVAWRRRRGGLLPRSTTRTACSCDTRGGSCRSPAGMRSPTAWPN